MIKNSTLTLNAWTSYQNETQNQVEKLSRRLGFIPSAEKIKEDVLIESGSLINHPRDMLQKTNRPCKSNQKQRNASARTLKTGQQKVSWKASQTSTKEVTPGYIYQKKGTDENATIHVTLTDKFWDSSTESSSKSNSEHTIPSSTSISQTSINPDLLLSLERKIAELRLQMEEMRLDHLETMAIMRSENECLRKKKDENFAKKLRSIDERHASTIENMKIEHKRALEELQYDFKRRGLKQEDEINFLKEKFNAHTDFVGEEMQRKFEDQKRELEVEHELKTQQALFNLRTKLDGEKDIELNKLTSHNTRRFNEIQQSHQAQIDKLLERYSHSAEDAEKLKEALKQVKDLSMDHKRLLTDHEQTLLKLNKTEHELDDVKIELAGFKNNFHEKVAEVEERFADKTNDLIVENGELRKMYLKKCEELHHFQRKADSKQLEELEDAKELMKSVVNSRLRSNMSLLSDDEQPVGGHDPVLDARRPSSAPTALRKTIKYRRKSPLLESIPDYNHSQMNLNTSQHSKIKLPEITIKTSRSKSLLT
ncbi:flagellum-associated coiled-coil domain-containing protein 1-like [Clytia hemisphaerica]|uniref:Uncharacterized protein n=1 Tax=Clytia hemisphaerica TaxID=252671 RepID=A0A7M6DN58_9CNID|eukprot:TCONS_00059118-protein